MTTIDGDYNGITMDMAVTDDETAGVSITPTQLTIAEGGSDSYEVVLTSQPSHDVTEHHSQWRPGHHIDARALTFTHADWNQGSGRSQQTG